MYGQYRKPKKDMTYVAKMAKQFPGVTFELLPPPPPPSLELVLERNAEGEALARMFNHLRNPKDEVSRGSGNN